MPTMDERPPIWVGHVAMVVSDPAQSSDWWEGIGLRRIHRGADISILELRGGTHLLLFPGEPEGGPAPFDCMVDDVDATHASFVARNLAPDAIARGEIHDQFVVRDPDGYEVQFSNSHVEGPV
jgi:catechol 2,3-dioxygenase-like lactoylglutathione lyase family enzyme